jgi:hypothetical protein
MSTEMNNRIWRDAMASGDDCLDLSILERIADAGPSGADAKSAAHLAQCLHCQAELTMLKRFESAEPLEGEGAAVAWIAAQLQKNAPGAGERAGISATSRVSVWQSIFGGAFAWKPLAAALALVFVFGAGYLVMRDGKPPIHVPELGGTFRSGTVKLIGPAGETGGVPAQLEWKAFDGAKGYSIELMEVDGTVLTKLQTPETHLTLKPEQTRFMLPGKPIIWKVTALDANGKEIPNSAGRMQFKVARP